MLELENLSKTYDEFLALEDLSLTVPPGEFFCFLGPNGAGKTTTIKIITGLLRPTKGCARIDGRDIQRDPIEAKRRIGYIPDQPYLYEKLSGRDFFHFVGNLFEIPRAEREASMKHYFEVFSLSAVADTLIENYSFGMRQKLCFSVALMHRPKLLVVDEPMVGLDPRSAKTVKNLLKDFCRNGGTVFLSTHLLAIAEELCDRMGIITRGKLRYIGTVDGLRQSMERSGNLEELFLELTADGVTDDSQSPFLQQPAAE
ncbi:MAG: ABC transporter ATP-binding protein [Candidatus Sumerlaeia bacterium]|nr:ABC transporter ATP-binding protein [Candidatus Sumerlaeia bacterium]